MKSATSATQASLLPEKNQNKHADVPVLRAPFSPLSPPHAKIVQPFANARPTVIAIAAQGLRPDTTFACAHESPLFHGLSSTEFEVVAAAAQHRCFLRRQVLFHEGEAVLHVAVLLAGKAKVSQLSATGQEIIVRVDGARDVVGGLGLFPGSIHPCTAQAVDTCQVLLWDLRTFELLSERFPVIRRNAIAILAKRLRVMEERFLELATERVASRLARTLTRLLSSIGQPAEGGAIRIALSREELAQMTGTRIFSVSRLLSSWEAAGIVGARREAVLIYNPSALAEIVDERAA